MDLRFTTEELAFRDEVRAFFRANLPGSIRAKLVEGKKLAKEDVVTWQRVLNKKGWAVANWPVEWGGTGWTPVQQYIFQEELQLTPAPQPLGFGVTMVGPEPSGCGAGPRQASSRTPRASRSPSASRATPARSRSARFWRAPTMRSTRERPVAETVSCQSARIAAR